MERGLKETGVAHALHKIVEPGKELGFHRPPDLTALSGVLVERAVNPGCAALVLRPPTLVGVEEVARVGQQRVCFTFCGLSFRGVLLVPVTILQSQVSTGSSCQLQFLSPVTISQSSKVKMFGHPNSSESSLQSW